MGKGIIQLIMAEYAKDQDGRWHELLFEIVNGRPSGAEEGEGGVRPPYADGCVSPYDVGYVSPIWGWRSESVCGAGRR